MFSLNVFNRHINMQWGRATGSTNISYGSSPTIQIEGEHRFGCVDVHLGYSSVVK